MLESSRKFHIVAISGSVRPGNYTSKALAFVVEELKKQDNVTVEVIDPAEINLTLPGMDADDSVKQMVEKVKGATGIILATPEYHGSYSSVMKLIIDNLEFPSVLSGKPIALLGVAAGQIGAIKALEHLRSVCSHVGSIVLPGPVSVAGVSKVIDESGNCSDANVQKLLEGLAHNLLDYIYNHICPKIALEEMVRSN